MWPHGLGYVNELWGGTSRGYLRVSESNYDWGQGLKELARWQREHGVVPLNVWYFGTDPALRTMPLTEFPLHTFPVWGPDDLLARVRGGYLAVNTTLLYGSKLTEAQERAAAYLRPRRPVARTTTFFIYDFRDEPGGGSRAPISQS